MVRNRRKFFRVIAISAIASIALSKLFFTSKDYTTLATLLEDLFPFDHQKLHTYAYIQSIMKHPRISRNEKDFLKESLAWLEKESQKHFGERYATLPKAKREGLLQMISQERWGEQFLASLLGYIFEALLGDPIYGINTDTMGWRWLGFTPGFPRPKEAFLG